MRHQQTNQRPTRASRRVIRGAAFVLAATTALAGGVAGAAAPTGDVSPTTDSRVAERPASSSEPAADRYGGSVTINVHSEAPTLDPLETTSFGTHYRLGPAMSRLVTWETGPDVGYGQMTVEPDLAESWEVSDDGLTYTFTLRDDVVWHDIAPVDGRSLTSSDVVATLEAIQADGVQQGLLRSVESIAAPDDHTVVLTLSTPYAPMLGNLAHHNMWILPEEAFDGSYDRSEVVIGTGPFVMVDRQPEVETRYERNAAYYGTDAEGNELPYLDEVTILPLTDLDARLRAFESGQIDVWFGPLSTLETEGLEEAVADLQVTRTVANTQSEMFFNQDVEALDDLRVRQAINLAIDRNQMGDIVRGGGELGGVVGPALTDFALADDERQELYGSPDVDEARRLLEDAGHADGLSLEMLVLDYGEEYLREAEWVQQDLGEIGIDVDLRVVDTTSGREIASAGDFELLYLIMSPFLEADDYLFNHFDPDGPRNYSNIDDPTLNEMIDEQRVELDPDARREQIHEIERYVHENVLNPLPMWASELRHPVHPHVHGYYPHISQGFPMLSEMYVTE